jgi:hypothetical protein
LYFLAVLLQASDLLISLISAILFFIFFRFTSYVGLPRMYQILLTLSSRNKSRFSYSSGDILFFSISAFLALILSMTSPLSVYPLGLPRDTLFFSLSSSLLLAIYIYLFFSCVNFIGACPNFTICSTKTIALVSCIFAAKFINLFL